MLPLFPVLATLPDGRQLSTCRIQHIAAYTDAAGEHAPETVVWFYDREQRAPVAVARGGALTQQDRREWTLDTGDGFVHLIQQSGCGCGHPLKAWRPPDPVRA